MDFAETFKEEAYELLAALETHLLELEEHPDDMELIGAVFRALHTIKGSGSMFGFDDISSFAHEVENVFEIVRQGELQVTPILISFTLASQDLIRKMLDGETGLEEKIGNVITGLKGVYQTSETTSLSAPDSKLPPESTDSETTYRIRFKPAKDLLLNGSNPLFLLEELSMLGHCDITTYIDTIPEIHTIEPESCYLSWDIILTTDKGEDTIKDVFIFVEDDCQLDISTVDSSDDSDIKKLGEILVERGDVSTERLEETLQKQKPLGEILVAEGITTNDKVSSALAEQDHVKNARAKQQTKKRSSSIRVQSEKLDRLVDLVGELVTVQARLSQTAGESQDGHLLSISETVEQLTWELRDNAMSIRMLPIGSTFEKFKRLVRDLSKDLGKKIKLETSGSETELDKNVLEQLNDPMVHLIRNAVDHGIEQPDERTANGKGETGTIHLSASHAGANVIIKIKDDGGGMKKEKILEKAISKGLVQPDQELTDQEIFALILLPGFSTNESITSTSGRGVGMDVVKKNIDALSGTIEINSSPGAGSEIRLKLPLTLAIIEGLLVEVCGSSFIAPLSIVEECIELPKEKSGNQIINLRGEFVPYIHLKDQFNIEGQSSEFQQIVLTNFDGTKLGIVVDKVIGEHQTVIKNLGSIFKDIEDVSGATILGDGTLALILDIHKLYHSSQVR